MRTVLCLLTIVLLLAVPARAEDREMVRIDITEPLPIEMFLQVVGRVGDFPLVWDGRDRSLQGDVIGAMELSAPKEELFGLVRGILFSRGLVLAPLGPAGSEIYYVVHVKDTGTIVRPEVITVTDENVDTLRQQQGRYVAATLRAPHLSDLAAAEKRLDKACTMSSVGSVTPIPAAKALSVVDFAPAVATMYRALQQMDEAAASATTAAEVLRLRHARASELAAVLEHAFAANRPLPDANALLKEGLFEPPPHLRITPDPRTNSLLVGGPRKDVEAVLRAIPELDVPVMDPDPAVWTHVVRLKKVSASSAANTLVQLLPRPGAAAPSSFLDSARVVAHEDSNALLVTATPHDFEQIKALLDEIDRAE